MRRYSRWVFLILCASWPIHEGLAGIKIEVTDPRYFERQHPVMFPLAQVKLVVFEFVSVNGDESGKRRATELHAQFLARIRDIGGAAIITLVTPPGRQIQDYRVEAEKFGKEQKAQMGLWGRILVDDSGKSLINARLALIDAPPGISATYSRTARLGPSPVPVDVSGIIDGPVTQSRVDFSTLASDVSPLVNFLSGLALYYKGAAPTAQEAAKWLKMSIADFEQYIRQIPETSDATALATAQLYLARAYVRLADAEPGQRDPRLSMAEMHANQAGRLNPYDPEVPTTQAIIAARRVANPEVIRERLVRAVTLAPGDSNARINLAVLESAHGQTDAALHQLDNASFVHKAQTQQELPPARELREQLIRARKQP